MEGWERYRCLTVFGLSVLLLVALLFGQSRHLAKAKAAGTRSVFQSDIVHKSPEAGAHPEVGIAAQSNGKHEIEDSFGIARRSHAELRPQETITEGKAGHASGFSAPKRGLIL